MADSGSPTWVGAGGAPLRRRALLALASGAALGAPAVRAQQARPLRIGVTVDSTGVEKANGTGLIAGATACVEALNRAGGIHGAQLELALMDDGFKPEVAKANAERFAADPGVLAVLHPLGTQQSAAVCAAASELAVVGPYSGTVALRKKTAANTFWVRASYTQEIERLIRQAASVGQTRIALVHSLDPFGQALLEAFSATMASAKLQPAVVATTPSTVSPEVEPAAKTIAAAAPQAVIVGLAGTTPAFVKAFRGAGGGSATYGLSIMAGAVATMGELARGVGFAIVVPPPTATRYDVVRRYQRDMAAAGQKTLSLPSMEGYINASVLAEGLRRAGPAPSRARLIAALESVQGHDLGGMKLSFGPGNREGSQFVDVAVVGAGGRILT